MFHLLRKVLRKSVLENFTGIAMLISSVGKKFTSLPDIAMPEKGLAFERDTLAKMSFLSMVM